MYFNFQALFCIICSEEYLVAIQRLYLYISEYAQYGGYLTLLRFGIALFFKLTRHVITAGKTTYVKCLMVQLVSNSLIGDPLLKHVAPLSIYIFSGVTVVTLIMYIFFYYKTLSGWRLRVTQNRSGHSGTIRRNYCPHLEQNSSNLNRYR